MKRGKIKRRIEIKELVEKIIEKVGNERIRVEKDKRNESKSYEKK